MTLYQRPFSIPCGAPIVIDETADASARLPDRFPEVQWIRLPGGNTTPKFVRRIAMLLTDLNDSGDRTRRRLSKALHTVAARAAGP